MTRDVYEYMTTSHTPKDIHRPSSLACGLPGLEAVQTVETSPSWHRLSHQVRVCQILFYTVGCIPEKLSGRATAFPCFSLPSAEVGQMSQTLGWASHWHKWICRAAGMDSAVRGVGFASCIDCAILLLILLVVWIFMCDYVCVDMRTHVQLEFTYSTYTYIRTYIEICTHWYIYI